MLSQLDTEEPNKMLLEDDDIPELVVFLVWLTDSHSDEQYDSSSEKYFACENRDVTVRNCRKL